MSAPSPPPPFWPHLVLLPSTGCLPPPPPPFWPHLVLLPSTGCLPPLPPPPFWPHLVLLPSTGCLPPPPPPHSDLNLVLLPSTGCLPPPPPPPFWPHLVLLPSTGCTSAPAFLYWCLVGNCLLVASPLGRPDISAGSAQAVVPHIIPSHNALLLSWTIGLSLTFWFIKQG